MFRYFRYLAATALVFALSGVSAGAGLLSQANDFYKGHSYKLALDKYREFLAGNPSGEDKRHAMYMAAICERDLGQWDQAVNGLEEVLKDSDSDIYAGRAHWRLGAMRAERIWSIADGTTRVLEHVRRAEEILEREKSNERADFFLDVTSKVLYPANRDRKDREYLFSFFDKRIPLLTDKEKIAETLISKADAAAYVTGEDKAGKRLAGLRQVVAEFPETKTAAGAQFRIAQDFMGRGDLVTALKEFLVVPEKWPGTNEAKSARETADQIRRQEVGVELTSAFLPDEPIRFVLRGRNVTDVAVSLVPFEPEQLLRSQRKQRFDLSLVSGSPAHKITVALEKRSDYTPTTAAVELKFHEPGAYVLKAEAGSATARSLLLISDILLVSNSCSKGFELWVVDAVTGRPRPDATIAVGSEFRTPDRTIFNRNPEPEYSKFFDLKVDQDGFAEVNMAANADRNAMVIARDGKHIAFLDNNYWYGGSERANAQLYVYTDRSVYRPKQKVYWRAIIRDRKDGEFQNVSGQVFHVIISDPKGATLFEDKEMKAGEFGTLSGELELAERAPLGQYNINVRSDRMQRHGGGQFRVEEYKKPEYEVSVSSADKVYRMGSEVKAEIAAKYYFGAPVADAQVKVTVRRRPHWFPWWRISEGPSDLGWFDSEPKDRGPMHGSQGDIVADLTGKTDAEGKYTLSFKADLPPAEPPQRRWWWGGMTSRTFDFQIEATVTDKSRRNIDGSDTIVVSDRALQISARTQQNLYTPGDQVKVDLRSRNFSDEPVATSGTLYVEKVRWLPDAQKDEVTTLSTEKADIDASGSLTVTWRPAQDQTGRLRFLFQIDDAFGERSSAYADFTVADEKTKDIFFKYQGIQIVADKEMYDVGDTARVMVLSEFPDAVAWYWIDSGTGNLEKKLLPLPDRTNFVKIPITDAFVPNSMIHVVAVRDRKVLSDQKELIVPPKKKVLNVAVTPDKAVYKPGEAGAVEIMATDYAGKPVRAEFSLSMFDRSILYIAPEMREDIRRAFYGERRRLQSSLSNSTSEPGGYNSADAPVEFWFVNERFSRDWDDASAGALAMRGDGRHYKSVARGRAVMRESVAFDLEASPAPAPSAAAPMAMEKGKDKLDSSEMPAEGAAVALVEAKVRSDFRDSMFWTAAAVTDEQGRASVKVTFPDSLTTWKAVAVGVTADSLVGNHSTEAVVKKNLMVRLEAPRFFRERDKVTLSAIVHNYLDKDKDVKVSLAASGLTAPDTEAGSQLDKVDSSRTINVKAGAEARADWTVDARRWGDATVKMIAQTDEESDAVEMKFPVLPHGIDKFVAWNGTSEDKDTTGATVTASDAKVTIRQEIDVPAERVRSSGKLTVVVNASLASAIRDALPYLVGYPYGCVEQTMSRFVPAAVVAGTFRDLNIPRDPWLEQKLAEATRLGVDRLRDFQHGDGSWGWWRDDKSNAYMTAYVLNGLTLARNAGVEIEPQILSKGASWLREWVQDFDKRKETHHYWRSNDLHTLVLGLFVLTNYGQPDATALEHAWQKRDDLSANGLAMLARTLWRAGRQDDARTVLQNMYNHAVITPENDTASWGKLRNCWYWWDDAVEATAQGLMAYVEIQPDEPMAARAMKWLVLNRQGRQWKSSKDTGQAVMALTAYMKQRKETTTDMQISVTVGNNPGAAYTRTWTITPDNFWSFDGKFVLEGDAVPDGKYPVTITKSGKGTLFYSVFAEYFTLEEGIKKAGNEIFVERTYEKLVRKSVQSTTGVVAVDTWTPVKDGDALNSGDELRVTLKIKSLNDYEYLVFEDAKPAGMEPVALQSGSTWGNGFCSNMELRDQFVAFFVTYMPQGEHTITYNCRTEIPGTFHTMPTKGYAMYFPPLRANSDELVVTVRDAE